MQTFNIKRFKYTLLWQVANGRRNINSILAFGIIFALFPAVLFLLKIGSSTVSPEYAASVAPVFITIAAIYFVTCGALIVNNISDKLKRINAFLLPSSKLEKFASRYLYLLVIVPVTAFAGLVVGDIVQMLVYEIAVGDACSITLSLLDGTHSFFPMRTEDAVLTFLALWLVHSVFLLFGTFFRRHAWIKSALLALGLLIALSLIFAFSTVYILDLIYGERNYNLVLIDAWWAYALEYMVIAAIIAFNYWASFRICSRMQAVNNKWHNF